MKTLNEMTENEIVLNAMKLNKKHKNGVAENEKEIKERMEANVQANNILVKWKIKWLQKTKEAP